MLQPTWIGFFGFCFLADFPTALHEFNQQQTTSTASTLFLNNNLTTTPLLSSSSSQHSVASHPSKIQSPRSHYSRPWNPSFLSVFCEVSFSTPAFKKPKGTVATTETWTLAKQKTITPPKPIPSHCQLSRRRPTKTFLIRTHGKKPERLPIFVPSTPGISQTTSCRHPTLPSKPASTHVMGRPSLVCLDREVLFPASVCRIVGMTLGISFPVDLRKELGKLHWDRRWLCASRGDEFSSRNGSSAQQTRVFSANWA